MIVWLNDWAFPLLQMWLCLPVRERSCDWGWIKKLLIKPVKSVRWWSKIWLKCELLISSVLESNDQNLSFLNLNRIWSSSTKWDIGQNHQKSRLDNLTDGHWWNMLLLWSMDAELHKGESSRRIVMHSWNEPKIVEERSGKLREAEKLKEAKKFKD